MLNPKKPLTVLTEKAYYLVVRIQLQKYLLCWNMTIRFKKYSLQKNNMFEAVIKHEIVI